MVRDGEFCSDCRGGRSTLSYRTVDLVVVVIGLYSREELSVSHTPISRSFRYPNKMFIISLVRLYQRHGKSMSVYLSQLIVNLVTWLVLAVCSKLARNAGLKFVSNRVLGADVCSIRTC